MFRRACLTAFVLVAAAALIAPPAAQAQRSRGAAEGGQLTLPRESALDLLSRLDALETQLRELRNLVELQRNEIERLKSAQRDQTRDLDQRLLALERGAAEGGGPVASAPRAEGATPGSAAVAAVTPGPARSTPSPQEQREYDAAFNLLKQGLYTRASEAFRTFVEKYPRSALAGNAQYWTAEANYVVRNFGLALEEFNRVLANYPESTKVADAMLKIGYSYYELNNWDKARETLDNVIARYPNTTVAKLAEIRLAKMKQEGH